MVRCDTSRSSLFPAHLNLRIVFPSAGVIKVCPHLIASMKHLRSQTCDTHVFLCFYSAAVTMRRCAVQTERAMRTTVYSGKKPVSSRRRCWWCRRGPVLSVRHLFRLSLCMNCRMQDNGFSTQCFVFFYFKMCYHTYCTRKLINW